MQRGRGCQPASAQKAITDQRASTPLIEQSERRDAGRGADAADAVNSADAVNAVTAANAAKVMNLSA
jgi:hypothetical protein